MKRTSTKYSINDACKSFCNLDWDPDAPLVEKLFRLANGDEEHFLNLNVLDPTHINSLGQRVSLPNYIIDGKGGIEISINSYDIDDEENQKLCNRTIFRKFPKESEKISLLLREKRVVQAALNNHFIASYFNDGGCEARAFFTLELLIAAGFDQTRISYCYMWKNSKDKETLAYVNPANKTDHYQWHVAICIDKKYIIDPTVNKNRKIRIKEWLDHFNFSNKSVIEFDPISDRNTVRNGRFYLTLETSKNYLLFLPCGFSILAFLKQSQAFEVLHFLKKNRVSQDYFLSIVRRLNKCKYMMFKLYFGDSAGPFQEMIKQLSVLNFEIASCKYIASNLISPNETLVSTKQYFFLIAAYNGFNELRSLLLQQTKSTIDPLLSLLRGNRHTTFSLEDEQRSDPLSEHIEPETGDTSERHSGSDSTLRNLSTPVNKNKIHVSIN